MILTMRLFWHTCYLFDFYHALSQRTTIYLYRCGHLKKKMFNRTLFYTINHIPLALYMYICMLHLISEKKIIRQITAKYLVVCVKF